MVIEVMLSQALCMQVLLQSLLLFMMQFMYSFSLRNKNDLMDLKRLIFLILDLLAEEVLESLLDSCYLFRNVLDNDCVI